MSLSLNSLGFIPVTSAGTRVPLSANSIQARFVRLQPRRNTTTTNTGNVYVYTQASGGNPFAVLSPEQTDGFHVGLDGLTLRSSGDFNVDLAQIWIDADTTNDAVLVGYVK